MKTYNLKVIDSKVFLTNEDGPIVASVEVTYCDVFLTEDEVRKSLDSFTDLLAALTARRLNDTNTKMDS